ncbi:hypothetical protein LA6_001598 [Marinibacterium anthonyi]|nr:hypothetical protein LA6_001598 [Marinibacterium anthonyi]
MSNLSTPFNDLPESPSRRRMLTNGALILGAAMVGAPVRAERPATGFFLHLR